MAEKHRAMWERGAGEEWAGKHWEMIEVAREIRGETEIK